MMGKGIRRDIQKAFSDTTNQKLMVVGFVCPEMGCALSNEIRRGMSIFSKEGRPVGKVAAVVLNNVDHNATHLLLCRLPEVHGYWLVPVSWIAQVNAEEVHLCAPEDEILSLPEWHEPEDW